MGSEGERSISDMCINAANDICISNTSDACCIMKHEKASQQCDPWHDARTLVFLEYTVNCLFVCERSLEDTTSAMVCHTRVHPYTIIRAFIRGGVVAEQRRNMSLPHIMHGAAEHVCVYHVMFSCNDAILQFKYTSCCDTTMLYDLAPNKRKRR